MAFDDIFKLFSVREGTPQGKAIENRMIDAMGGPETIRKKFHTSPDGSGTTPPKAVVDEPRTML